MKRTLAFLLVLILFPCVSFAKSYTLKRGVYEVGVDIPEGHYIVTSHKDNIAFAAVSVFDDTNRNNKYDIIDDKSLLYFTVMHPNNAYFDSASSNPKYYVRLENGNCVDIIDKVVFETIDNVTLAPQEIYSQLFNYSNEDLEMISFQADLIVRNKKRKEAEKNTPKATPAPNYSSLNYERVARMPEKCIDEKVKFSGIVIQVMGSREKGYDIRLATKDGYDDIVYLYIPPEAAPSINILEDDKITVKGTIKGDHAYTSIWGQEITLPLVHADSVSITLSEKKTTTIGYSDGTSDYYVNGVLTEPDSTSATVTKGVNIRAEANANSEKVGSAKPGDRLTVLQAYYTSKWHQILYNGEVCYVSANYVKLN